MAIHGKSAYSGNSLGALSARRQVRLVLCRGGRDDDLHQAGVDVIDQTRDEEFSRQGPSNDVDVDPDGGVRIADRLGVQLFDRDLEVCGSGPRASRRSR
jgi:hypothetical protein